MQAFLGASPAVFLILTVALAGGAAMLAGRAVAHNWKPAWQVIAAAAGLAVADRFLVFALFGGDLLGLWGFLVAFVVIAGVGLLSWRLAQVAVMVRQYPWRYERASLLAWREKPAGPAADG